VKSNSKKEQAIKKISAKLEKWIQKRNRLGVEKRNRRGIVQKRNRLKKR